MTPLGASLGFITISIIISVVKYFIFPSNSSSSFQQSQIQLKQLYTITNKIQQKQNKSYSSFYQAYYKFHIQQTNLHGIDINKQNFTEQYNGLVMKKSIINDQMTIICQENFLITIQQGLNCEENKKDNAARYATQGSFCNWETKLNVYQLPYLKQETKQSINIQGRIGITDSQHNERLKHNIQCKKQKDNSYSLTFPFAKKTQHEDNQNWSINILSISKNQISKQYQSLESQYKNRKNSQKSKSTKPKPNEPKRYNFPKPQSIKPKPNNSNSYDLNVKLIEKSLLKSYHRPLTYNSDNQVVVYSTKQQPWLIRYSFIDSNNIWSQLNILEKNTQTKIEESLRLQSRIPPFQRSPHIQISYLFTFQTVENIYLDDCEYEERDYCNQKQKIIRKNYISLVYLHSNSQYRVEKFFIQLTFQINQQIEAQSASNSSNQNQKLISYSMLISQINPSRNVQSDCQMYKHKENIYQRHFDKYFWLYENKLMASLDRYSLLCVFTFDLDQYIRIVEIDNIVFASQGQMQTKVNFLDWKTLKKIVNYKDQYQTEIAKNQLKISSQMHSNYTRNKTQLNYKNSSKNVAEQTEFPNQNNNKKDSKNQFGIENQTILKYIQVINEQYLQNSQQTKNKNKVKKISQNNKSKSTKKLQKKINEQKDKTVKSQNKEKLNKKKKKGKNNKNQNLLFNMTAVQGQYKPTLQTSFNYSFYRDIVFPHKAKMQKYKFPLPFLLSFTKNMQIINSDPQKPVILFSGIKQYIFTYKNKNQIKNQSSSKKINDYRYLILGANMQSTQKNFKTDQGNPSNQIKTSKDIIKKVQQHKLSQKLNIQIKDETHPQIQNVFKAIFSSDQEILNQIKCIQTVPVETNSKRKSGTQVQTYQRYLIVVWGWGIQVYEIDWDKSGFLRENVSKQQIQQQLSKKSQSLIHYFLPFIELFATIYCMFQALISSR